MRDENKFEQDSERFICYNARPEETPEQHSASAIVCPYDTVSHKLQWSSSQWGLGIRALHLDAAPPPVEGRSAATRYAKESARRAPESLSFSAPIQIIHATGIVH